MADSTRTAAPWHLWAVGVVSLLWNAFGGYDYVMTQIRDPAYLSHLPAEMGAYLDSFPVWSTAAWAIGVWGSVLGSLLLLVRSRHAAAAFLVAWVSTAITFTYHYVVGMPPSIDTPGINAFKALIFALIVAFWWYARRAAAQGILR